MSCIVRFNKNEEREPLMFGPMKITYEGWEKDYNQVEDAHFDGNDLRFERLVKKMDKKQRVFNGDRSHKRLIALDELISHMIVEAKAKNKMEKKSHNQFGSDSKDFFYPGFMDDVRKAENCHYDWENSTEFFEILKGMENKQRLYSGDRSHPDIVKLDSLRVSYPSWEEDFIKAEDAHQSAFDWRFERIFQMMKKKQQVHDGNRSHKRLVELDALSLSYPGWEADFQEAEILHCGWEDEGEFYQLLEGMKNKQSLHMDRRSHPNLVKLDELALTLTYPGFEKDVKKVENAHKEGVSDRGFERRLEKIRRKQSVFKGDRSHPEIVGLDKLHLSYPGWEDDVREAEALHFHGGEGNEFWSKLSGMHRKQKFYIQKDYLKQVTSCYMSVPVHKPRYIDSSEKNSFQDNGMVIKSCSEKNSCQENGTVIKSCSEENSCQDNGMVIKSFSEKNSFQDNGTLVKSCLPLHNKWNSFWSKRKFRAPKEKEEEEEDEAQQNEQQQKKALAEERQEEQYEQKEERREQRKERHLGGIAAEGERQQGQHEQEEERKEQQNEQQKKKYAEEERQQGQYEQEEKRQEQQKEQQKKKSAEKDRRQGQYEQKAKRQEQQNEQPEIKTVEEEPQQGQYEQQKRPIPIAEEDLQLPQFEQELQVALPYDFPQHALPYSFPQHARRTLASLPLNPVDIQEID